MDCHCMIVNMNKNSDQHMDYIGTVRLISIKTWFSYVNSIIV